MSQIKGDIGAQAEGTLSDKEQDFVSRVVQFAQLLDANRGTIIALRTLYFGQKAGYNVVITDEALQSIPSLAHLKAQNIAEIMDLVFALDQNMAAKSEDIAVVAQ